MLDPRLKARIETKKAQLDALRPLPRAALTRLWERITLEWIYNSNAIEGNTLTLKETRLVLETGLTIAGKSLREHFEVLNHKEAIDFVEDLARKGEPITAHTVRQIHALVLAKIDDAEAGQYRKLPVRIGGANHRPPEPWDVPHLMQGFAEWLATDARLLHPVQRASEAHHRLVYIHPFIDGNGRTARLVMNLLLMQDGYPPTVIRKVDRRSYYSALAKADAGNLAPLINFVGRAVEHALTVYLEALTPQEGPPAAEGEYIPLAEAAKGTPYSQEYLSLLARKGRLEAIKRGRNWVTTRRAVEAYLRSVGKLS
ncbi:MAG: Fic family protein [Anaerolineae bacterium]